MTFTKEQLIAQAEGNITMLRASLEHVKDPFERDDISTDLRLAEIALASLEAEPVLYAAEETLVYSKHGELHLTCLSEPMGDAVIPLYSAPPAPVVEDIGEISVGRLPTMNQDDYPGLGDWWVQLRTGKDSDEVLARVYGATPQEANGRAEALACRAAMLKHSAPFIVTSDHRMMEMPKDEDIDSVAAMLQGKSVKQTSSIKTSDCAGKGEDIKQSSSNEPVSHPYTLPEGVVIVPVEPTREMRLQIHPIAEATCTDCGRSVTVDCENNVLLSWADMIAAAPQQEADNG